VTGDLSLVFTSRDVQPETPFINETFKFVGPSINHENRAKNEEFPFEQIKRKPVIYISLGTVNNRDLSFYRRCFQAFAEFPGQFILSVGQSTDLAQLGPIPENFIVRNSVPQLELLQQVDLFISHAGMNSLHESLYYGVPLVMIPQHMEQLANARIAALRGVGIVLGGMGAYGKVSVADLREAVNTVLGQSRFRQMAQSISQSLQAAGGYLQAANEIEILAARKIITQGNEKFAVTLDAKPDDAVLATDGPGSLYSQ
jgi:MGT family glycosyltransferase